MQKMLNYNPAERIAAKTALDRLYFDNLDKSQSNALHNGVVTIRRFK